MTTNTFLKGMNQDISPKYQEEGSYRMALNSVIETQEGDMLMISNELGNESWASGYPSGKKIIGHRLLDNGTTVLFIFDPDPDRPEHEIGIFDPKTKTYTTYVKGTCLNFSDNNYVNAIFRLKNGCERIVYFTDNLNPYRVINLDRPEYYTSPPFTTLLSCDALKYTRDFYPVSMDAEVNNSGGLLEVGVYLSAVRYLDQDRNPTDWFFISNPISIADESEVLLTDPLTTNNYDGGVSNPDEIGYVPNTRKSILFTLSDVDTRFKYVQLAIIKYTQSSGALSSVEVLTEETIPPAPSALTIMEILYTGADSQVLQDSSLEEIFAKKQKLQKVLTHEQKDNRLFVANLTNTNKDYTGFQRHASAIRTDYVEEAVDIADALSKDSQYYFDEGSLLHDEIYALGIVYIWNDGEESPAFHIPGRGMIDNTGDTFGTNPYITADKDEWDTLDTTGDINIYNDAKTDRWQVYNTYTEETGTTGLMGYYQTDTTYPEIEVCNDDHEDGYWGRDWMGNLIDEDTFIRHHRMPHHAKTTVTNYHTKLGVKFTMDQDYPHPDIIGHYYVYGDRTYERTILDKGLIVPISSDRFPDGPPFDSTLPNSYAYRFPNESFHFPSSCFPGVSICFEYPLYGFVSANTLFNETLANGTYLTIEKKYENPTIDVSVNDETDNNTFYDQVVNFKSSSQIQHNEWANPVELNYKVKSQQFLRKASDQDGNVVSIAYIDGVGFSSCENHSISTSLGLFTLDRQINEIEAHGVTDIGWGFDVNTFFSAGNGLSASIKADTYIFRNLYTIEYKRFGNALLNKSLEVDLESTLVDGDIFVSQLGILDYIWWTDTAEPYVMADYANVVLEQDMNPGLRHEDQREQGKYMYYKFLNQSDLVNMRDFIAQSKYWEPSDGTFSMYPEAYLYSKAFSIKSSLSRYLPIPYDYDFCNDCLDIFPYRIMYSQADDIERRVDAYRTILPNNYKDIDGNSGPITDMFINYNNLYVNTPYTPYLIPTNTQLLNSSEDSTIYIGSAEVLQLPPRPLKNSDIAYGGTEFWKARVSTEFGTVYVDNVSKRVFLLTDNLQDISQLGMRNFWQKNADFHFLKQFKLAQGTDYSKYCLASPNAIGYAVTYDPRHKRVLIHKRDYKIKAEYETSFTVTDVDNPIISENTLWYDGVNYYYNVNASVQSLIDFGDPAFFENKSFTISYSFLNNQWSSYHSYLPYYMFNDADSFYSGDVLKHNEGSYQIFSGVKYDHIIDFIALNHPMESFITNSIQYSSNVYSVDEDNQFNYYVTPSTFDHVILYNDSQSTGKKELVIQDESFTSTNSSQIPVRKIDNKWRFNELRNNVISSNVPFWSSSWADIQSTPFNWIDKVPINIDFNKSLFQLERMKDRYVGVRLFFHPKANYKILTDLVQSTNQLKSR